MLARILGNNKKVFTFQELHFFEELWAPEDIGKKVSVTEAKDLLLQLFSVQREGYFRRHKNSAYATEASELIDNVYSERKEVSKDHLFLSFMDYETKKNGATVWCEQTPRNLFYVEEISTLFPQAKFIYIARDPRDVLFSQKKRWKRRLYSEQEIPFRITLRQWMNYHPILISLLWRKANTIGWEISQRENVKAVRYEDILCDPEREIKEICRFLELSFSLDMLDVDYQGSSHERTVSGQRGVRKENSGKWRQSELGRNELYICETLTNGVRSKLGYGSSGGKPDVGLLLLGLTLPLKLVGAFILNVGRVSNLASSLRRRL